MANSLQNLFDFHVVYKEFYVWVVSPVVRYLEHGTIFLVALKTEYFTHLETAQRISS
jgi:hypothetical protein